MQPDNEKPLTESEVERLARLNRERLARDREPVIPPEHIVSGECTFEALNTYLSRYAFDTIRAREAIRMYEWMYPLVNVMQANGAGWGLRDILGDGSQQQDEGDDNA